VTVGKAEFSLIASQKKSANFVEFAPNDKTLAVACQDKTVALIDVANRSILGRLQGHRRGVSSVTFSPIERVVASSSADGTVKLWNLNNFQCLRTLEADSNRLTVYNCAFLANGQQVMGVCGDGTLRLWNIRTGDCIWTEADVHDGKIWGFHVTAQNVVVTGDSEGKVAIFQDNTEESKCEETKKMADKIEKDTQISVLVSARKFHQAAILAMQLNRAGKFLEIVEEAGWSASDADIEHVDMESIVKTELQTEEGIEKVVGMTMRWISNARTAYLGQLVTNIMLKTTAIDKFAKVEGFNTFIEAVAGYGTKHDSRVERMAQRLCFVDGLLKSLHSVPLPNLDVAMGRQMKRARV
jgi:U3 small nucleolar RNA-associated protein 13